MASLQSIKAALESGRSVFVLNVEDNAYDKVESFEEVVGLSEKALESVRIDKEVTTKKVILGRQLEDGSWVTFDFQDLPTAVLNSGTRYTNLRKARAVAKRIGATHLIPISNPISYEEEFGEISYDAVVGEAVAI